MIDGEVLAMWKRIVDLVSLGSEKMVCRSWVSEI